MKILFAVMSAEVYIQNGMDDLIRQTWRKDAAQYGDFRFFCGRGGSSPSASDETVLPPDYVRVDAPDDKDNLIYKVEKMCLWAYQMGYDMMLKTDIDTFVNIPLLMQEYFDFDYGGACIGELGKPYGETGAYSFIQGSAMWLSNMAMQMVVDDVVTTMQELTPLLMKANGIISPYPHSEDLWIGQVLMRRLHTISCCCHAGFSNGPLTYHFAICHSTCTQEEWDRRLREWFRQLHKGNYEYHQSR